MMGSVELWEAVITFEWTTARMKSPLNAAWLACVLCAYNAVCLSSLQAVDDQAVDESVVKALRFLATQQNVDGSWKIDQTGQSTAASSLAVMSFLAAGHVPDEGPYGSTISRGIDYVVAHQVANGMIIDSRGHGPMYDHGISTLMLSEVVGMASKHSAPRIRVALENGVRLILKAQQVRKGRRELGGWRYQHNSEDSDLSVTGWQLLALRAAKDIGCDVPIERIDFAVNYVKKCSNGRGFGYQPGSGPTSTLTAAGVLCLQVCDHLEDDEVHGGIQFLHRQPLHYNDSWFFYGAYYQAISAYKYGGADWDRTKAILFRELLVNQDANGSWEAKNANERPQGLIYSTSLSVLALTVEYGYLPIYQR